MIDVAPTWLGLGPPLTAVHPREPAVSPRCPAAVVGGHQEPA